MKELIKKILKALGSSFRRHAYIGLMITLVCVAAYTAVQTNGHFGLSVLAICVAYLVVVFSDVLFSFFDCDDEHEDDDVATRHARRPWAGIGEPPKRLAIFLGIIGLLFCCGFIVLLG